MAIINATIWEINGDRVFAYEYPQKRLSSNTQVNVGMNQEAIFVVNGKIQGKYGAGLHTLNTANVPVVRRFFGIPFGGQNPCVASVWYLNKADILSVDYWTSMFMIKDSHYPNGCPVIARVTYGMRVLEGEPFLVKFVNGRSPFCGGDMNENLRGRMETEITAMIAEYAGRFGLSLAELGMRKANLSIDLRNVMADFVVPYGLEIVSMNLVELKIDTSARGKEAASGFGLDQGSYQQSRILDIQEKAIDKLSSGEGGLVGAMMAMSVMNNMGSVSRSISYIPPSPGGVASPPPVNNYIKDVYCSKCAKKFPSNIRFCPHCGNEYNPCPCCGADNMKGARRCVSCGTSLVQETIDLCPHCGAGVTAGCAYCPSCGRSLNEDRCEKCRTPLRGATFCPACGHKNK